MHTEPDTNCRPGEDETAIEQLLYGCASAMDQRRLEALSEYFADDIQADYGVLGRFQGLPAVRGVIAAALGKCAGTQHLMGNVRVRVDGGRAEAHSYLQALHLGRGAYARQRMILWGEYHDRLERSAEGWRIVERRLVALYSEGDIGLAEK